MKLNWIAVFAVTAGAITWASLGWSKDDIACYYAGEDGHQRICEGEEPPTTAYCGDSRTADCCDHSVANWVAIKSAHYKFTDPSRSEDQQAAGLTVWECQLKEGQTKKDFYRPVHAADAAQSKAFYQSVNKLGSSPRFDLSDLEEPEGKKPPAKSSTRPADSGRTTEVLLNLNPEVAGVKPLTPEEKKQLSGTGATAGCGYVDVREKGLPPMRSAQLTGWTFANTAADLIEFANREKVASAAKKQSATGAAGSVSPTDLTLGYYQVARLGVSGGKGLTREQFLKFRKNPDAPVGKAGVGLSELEAGNTLGVLKAYRARGSKACLEKSLPAEDFPQVSCDGAESKKLDLRELVGCLDKMVTQLCSANLQGNDLEEARKQAVHKNETVLKSLFPGVSFDDFESTLGEAMKQGDASLAYIESLHQKACASPVALDDLDFEGLPTSQNKTPKPEDYESAMNLQLSNGQPVSLGVKRDLLLNPGLAAIEAPGVPVAKWAAQGQAVLAVGRRWNPSGAGQCEILIRPNLGTECSAIFRADAVPSCQAGYLWVPENQLKGSIQEIAYVKHGT